LFKPRGELNSRGGKWGNEELIQHISEEEKTITRKMLSNMWFTGIDRKYETLCRIKVADFLKGWFCVKKPLPWVLSD